MSEWIEKSFSNTSYLAIQDVSDFINNAEYVSDMLKEYNKYSSSRQYPDVSLGDKTIPYADYINEIERVVQNIIEGVSWNAGISKSWLGNRDDVELLSYEDANRWFNILSETKDNINAAPVSYRISGSFSSGNHIIVQQLRIGGY